MEHYGGITERLDPHYNRITLYCVGTICPLPLVYDMQALTAWTILRSVDACIYA